MKGKLVEYIDHNKMLCAFVMDGSDKRLRLLNQNGKEAMLAQSRITCAGVRTYSLDFPREELQRQLQACSERRKNLMADINLEEIWEVAAGESEETFDPWLLAELFFGAQTTEDHVAAFLRCVFQEKVFFKYREGRIFVHSAEVVAQIREQQEREREQEALLDNGARGIAELWEGKLDSTWGEKEKCLGLVRDYYLFGNDAEYSSMTREMLKKAGLVKPHDPFYLLVKAGVWGRDENIALLRHGLPIDFPEGLLDAGMYSEPDPETLLAGKRRDFRDLPVLTIDGESTRDFDDALHIEKKGADYLVGIHIADVSQYIKPGDPLFEEARKRITSIYFPERRVPMLPEQLSEGICSLLKGKPRVAMSFMVLLSRDGEVLDFNIVPSVVCVKRQLGYETVEESIDCDEELRALHDLSLQLRKKRIDAGAVLLPVPDVIIAPDSGEVRVSLSEVDSKARSLVAEFMVLANTLAAQYVSDRQVPGLFRSQKEPHKRFVVGYETNLFVLLKQRKYLSPAKLLTSPEAHSCVGVAGYTTVTSPIRRFLDLVMQIQISRMINRADCLAERDLLDYIRDIITIQSKVNLVRQLRHRYWILKYYRPHEGKRFDAMLVEKGPKRVLAVLLDTLFEVNLPPSRNIEQEPGDVVSVKIARVSPLDDILRVEW